MAVFTKHKQEIIDNGFTVIANVYSDAELRSIVQAIEQADSSKPTFRKTNDLFAIRQFLKGVPQALPFIFTDQLNDLINSFFGSDYFVVKSIYFDKPADSNWFVAYHQDLTISVNMEADLKDFGPWSVKQNQFAVQPPLYVGK